MNHEPTGFHDPLTAPGEFDKNGELTRPIWPVVAVFVVIFLCAAVVWAVRFFLQG